MFLNITGHYASLNMLIFMQAKPANILFSSPVLTKIIHLYAQILENTSGKISQYNWNHKNNLLRCFIRRVHFTSFCDECSIKFSPVMHCTLGWVV